MIHLGDKISLKGGYDGDPEWLKGVPQGFLGTAKKFLAQNTGEPLLVLELENEASIMGVTGNYLILSLRYVEAKWEDKGICHVVIAANIPDDPEFGQKLPKEEDGYKWVESNASFEKIEVKVGFLRKLVKFFKAH